MKYYDDRCLVLNVNNTNWYSFQKEENLVPNAAQIEEVEVERVNEYKYLVESDDKLV